MSIAKNGFSFSVISNNIQLIDNKYMLPNFSDYSINLMNNRKMQSDASIWIDGDNIGTWRIPALSKINIMRPANVNRRLVFIAEDKETSRFTQQAASSTIKVIFKPEAANSSINLDDLWFSQPKADNTDLYYNSSGIHTQHFGIKDNNYGYLTGGTVLGAGTDQKFNIAHKIQKYDDNNITEITCNLLVLRNNNINNNNNKISVSPDKYNNVKIYDLDQKYNYVATLFEKPFLT